MRQLTKKWLLWVTTVLLLLVSPDVLATTIDTSGSLVSAVNHVMITGWYSEMKTVAEEIFYTLFGIDFVYLVAQWLIGGKDVHEIFTSFIKKIITIGVFFTILLNAHALVWDVMNAFQAAGVKASGGVEPHTSIGWILGTGLNIAVACIVGPMHHGAQPPAGMGFFGWGAWELEHAATSAYHNITNFMSIGVDTLVGLLVGLLTGMIAIFALLYMAMEYLSIQIEAMVVSSLGVIMLGFSGSRWTSQHAEGYLKYALSVGLRWLVLVVWINLVETTTPRLITELLQGASNTGGLMSVLGAYLNILIFVVMIAWLTKKLPSIANSVLSGSSSLSGGELLGSAAKTAALAAAAVVTGGAVAGMAGAAGGTGALSASEAAAAGGEAGSLGASGGAGAAGMSGEAGSMGAANGANDAAGSSVEAVAAPETGTSPSGGQGGGTRDTAMGDNVPAPKDGIAWHKPESAPQPSGKGPSENQATQGQPSAGLATETATVAAGGVAADMGATAIQESGGTAGGTAGTPGTSGADATGGAGKDGAVATAHSGTPTVSAPEPSGTPQGTTPSGNTGTDHRPDAPNTPAQPVSGGSNDVPAPAKPESLLKKTDRYADTIQRVVDVASPGDADKADVKAAGLNLKHSE